MIKEELELHNSLPQHLRFPIPSRCIACGGETFCINGFKVKPESKFGDPVSSVMLYCNGKCKKFVAELLGKSTTWYVERPEEEK